MNRFSFYWEEYKLGGCILIFSISLLGMCSYLDLEMGTGKAKLVEATITDYGRSRAATAAPIYIFSAQLPNGLKVHINDTGQIPASYRGPITLEVKTGILSGRNIYQFNQESIKQIMHEQQL